MNELILVFPTNSYKEKILDYCSEFGTEIRNIPGTAGILSYSSFEEWYQDILANSKEETVREGLVPSTTYLAIRKSDDRLIGFIDCRHRLNKFLVNYGGHIGYSVRESERRKSYAKEMLSLALNKYKEMKINKVLLTCDKNNTASAKTILSSGGKLENEIQREEGLAQRYWIEIK